MLKYHDFCKQYLDSQNFYKPNGNVDSDKYKQFLKNETIYHKLENISVQDFGDFLKLALSVDRHVYKCIINDELYPDYKIAILKDSLAGGGIHLRLAFPDEPLLTLIERLKYTVIDDGGDGVILEMVEDPEDIEPFIIGRCVETYHEVMQARWMDYDEGRGKIKDWHYYLHLPEDYFER